jgi:hypothetical protein
VQPTHRAVEQTRIQAKWVAVAGAVILPFDLFDSPESVLVGVAQAIRPARRQGCLAPSSRLAVACDGFIAPARESKGLP